MAAQKWENRRIMRSTRTDGQRIAIPGEAPAVLDVDVDTEGAADTRSDRKPDPEAVEADRTCEKVKHDGQRCRGIAMHGSPYCFFHNPAAREARKAAQQSGGQANRAAVLPADAADLPLHSGKDVVALLAETINQVRKGQLSPKIASIVGYLSGPLLKALETSDTEERLTRVEHALQTRKSDESLFNPQDDED
jgi:hypothetical protein